MDDLGVERGFVGVDVVGCVLQDAGHGCDVILLGRAVCCYRLKFMISLASRGRAWGIATFVLGCDSWLAGFLTCLTSLDLCASTATLRNEFLLAGDLWFLRFCDLGSSSGSSSGGDFWRCGLLEKKFRCLWNACGPVRWNN